MPCQSARALLVLCLAAALPLAARAQDSEDFAGPYLAAREAAVANDFAAAARYSVQVLAADPGNLFLQEAALIAQVAVGDITAAAALAETMATGPNGSQMASLVRLAGAARSGDFAQVQALVAAGTNTGPLLDGLLLAWARLGGGQTQEALAGFNALAADESYAAFGLYHKALALASVGDFEGADAILSGAEAGPLRATRRSVIAHAQVLSQLDRGADALEMLTALFGPDPDPAIAALRDRLEAGEALPFSLIGSARDGLAEVFFTVAGALNSETPDSYALAYARFAEFVRPEHVDAVLLVASILERMKQYDLATGVYAGIARGNEAFHAAELGRAGALFEAGRREAALEVLTALARDFPDTPGIWSVLGDMQRRTQNYAEAALSYDRAIAIYGEPAPDQWFLYYARGMANERAGAWAASEADFRTALRLNPDQPQVLNYLGYSFVDRNENLDEALGMIERAVAAVPNDGAIVDSLGWVLYRLGRYQEAVGHMEKAASLMPVDALVNDHLGDVFWAVGRLREAEFQWRRALSFGTETEGEAARIRRKLEVGLDVVLAEEGMPPLKALAANGN
ncbi:tetratricopeptide repeat protein [Phaeovulum sp.]|uniref:tetratricopeptide repeat protein n=1 Tax=Phaeovulum sp. TaxID=2934796 RepID=UPI0027321BB2|nr:tetratricopeptide repeat protein [Phaeovulum sp.]MDP1668767.1 tetratricopeptide repeat protein [Phaeovulum sp.]MDZ4120583.1 tetratricopeptide repeat protein [Phaeovulum sp.]